MPHPAILLTGRTLPPFLATPDPITNVYSELGAGLAAGSRASLESPSWLPAWRGGGGRNAYQNQGMIGSGLVQWREPHQPSHSQGCLQMSQDAIHLVGTAADSSWDKETPPKPRVGRKEGSGRLSCSLPGPRPLKQSGQTAPKGCWGGQHHGHLLRPTGTPYPCVARRQAPTPTSSLGVSRIRSKPGAKNSLASPSPFRGNAQPSQGQGGGSEPSPSSPDLVQETGQQ